MDGSLWQRPLQKGPPHRGRCVSPQLAGVFRICSISLLQSPQSVTLQKADGERINASPGWKGFKLRKRETLAKHESGLLWDLRS